MIRLDVIAKEGGQFVVRSKSGRVLGRFPTREEAEKRLRQIEAFANDHADRLDNVPEAIATAAANAGAIFGGGEFAVTKIGEEFFVMRDGQPIDGPFPDESMADARREEFARGEVVDSVPKFDGSPVRRIDSMRVGLYTDKTPEDLREGIKCDRLTNGHLKIDLAYLTTTGVFWYADGEGRTWGEYRDEREVFSRESLDSFRMVTLTDDHPPEFVTADNTSTYQRGTVGSDVRRHHDAALRQDFMASSILVTHPETIRKIDEGKLELSNGYTAEVVTEDGIAPGGVPFHARQKNIRGNHVALVDRGRAGPECRLRLNRGDAFTIITPTPPSSRKDSDMDEVEITLDDGTKVKVSKAVAEQMDRLKSSAERSDSQPLTDAPSNDELRAKIDQLEADAKRRDDDDKNRSAEEAARIDRRVDLMTKARTVLDADELSKLDLSDEVAVMKAVIAKATPDVTSKLDGESADYVRASFDFAIKELDRREDVARENTEAFFRLPGEGPSLKNDVKKDLAMSLLGKTTET